MGCEVLSGELNERFHDSEYDCHILETRINQLNQTHSHQLLHTCDTW